MMLLRILCLLALTLHLPWAQGFTVVPSCSWDAPGANRYAGPVPKAVDAYRDLSEQTRSKLRRRMELRQYDEVVTIRRDRIEGANDYAPEIRDMHFGSRGRVCATVSRTKWKPEATERGLVYCEDGACVLVPTVCGNVSRVTRLAPRPLSFDPPAAGGPTEGGGDPLLSLLVPKVPELSDLPTIPETPPSELLRELNPGTFSGPGWQGWSVAPYVPLPNVPSVTPAVPEPETLSLVGLGLLAVALSQRRRR